MHADGNAQLATNIQQQPTTGMQSAAVDGGEMVELWPRPRLGRSTVSSLERNHTNAWSSRIYLITA
jgi:hypothetical protein